MLSLKIVGTLVLVLICPCVGFGQAHTRVSSLPKSIQTQKDQKVILDELLESIPLGIDSSLLNSGLRSASYRKDKAYTVGMYLLRAKFESNLGNNRSAVIIASQGIQYANEHKVNSEFIVNLHMVIAEVLERMGALSEAIIHRKKELYYKEKIYASADEREMYWMNGIIGGLFYASHKYDSALVYFEASIRLLKEKNNERMFGGGYNNIGLCFRETKDYKKAIPYFAKALQFYQKIEDKTDWDHYMIGVVQGNWARCLSDSNPDKEQLLQNDVLCSKSRDILGHTAMAMLYLVDYYRANNKFQEAERIFLDVSKMDLQLRYPEVYAKLLNFGSILYLNKKQPEKAQYYLDRYVAFQDSMYGKIRMDELLNQFTTYEIANIQNQLSLEEINAEKKDAEINVLLLKNRMIKGKWIVSLLAASLALVLVVFIVYKLKADSKKKELESQVKSQKLEKALEQNEQRLSLSAQGLLRKIEFADEIMNRLKRMKGLQHGELLDLNLFIKNEMGIDRNHVELNELIDQVGVDFLLRFRDAHPNLSETDLRLIVMIRMNLSLKEIAISKNISVPSVKIAKNRLTKKLGIGSENTLSGYVLTF